MNYTTLTTEFLSLVGFRVDSATVTLSGLTTSTSGRYFNDEDPLITLDNLKSICPSGVNLTTWLTGKVKGSIIKAFEDWRTAKVLNGSGKVLLMDDLMIKGVPDDHTSTWGNIGGIELTTRDSQSLSYALKLSLHLTATADVDIKIFEYGVNTPVHEQTLSYDTANSIKWFDIEYTLSGQKTYCIAYDMDGITAYNMMKGGTSNYFPNGRYYTARAVRHNLGIAELWDINQHTYVTDDNFGINLKVSATCDYTELIVNQKNSFANIIAKRVAIDLLNELSFNASANINRNEANIDYRRVDHKLTGVLSQHNNSKMDYSLMAEYNKALKAVLFDTSGIDKYCLKCKKGVTIGTI